MYIQEADVLRPWDQFLRYCDQLLELEGSACFEARLHDPEVIEGIATSRDRPKPSPPRLFGWTKEYSALRDLCDQIIAQRGGTKFVPRPEIPGIRERWQRKDSKLQNTVARLVDSE